MRNSIFNFGPFEVAKNLDENESAATALKKLIRKVHKKNSLVFYVASHGRSKNN